MGPKKQVEKWRKPDPDWVKFNLDGSLITRQNGGGIGGFLRDGNGGWLWGFSPPTTSMSVTTTAIKMGLEEAWEHCYPRIDVETDSQVVLSLLSDSTSIPQDPMLASLVLYYKRLLHLP